jgi:hypothetical protein
MSRIVFLLYSLALLSAGCATRESDYERVRGATGPVPSSARMISEGSGRLDFVAGETGVVYVWDLDAQRVIYSVRMQKRERFELDPVKGTILVDGFPTGATKLTKDHRYRLYFDRERAKPSA